jgi:hypothetical protein
VRVRISDSQANAEALVRRSAPYSAAHDASFRLQWDVHKREPDNLRDAVRKCRRAYADEVPDKLHDSVIGDDGAPRMNARAVGYIFGSGSADDASRNPETGEHDLQGFYYTPFRAALERMSHGADTERVYAAIVQSVTVGGQGPREAALLAGVQPDCLAKSVALMAMRAFLRSMTDIRVHEPIQVHSDAVA